MKIEFKLVKVKKMTHGVLAVETIEGIKVLMSEDLRREVNGKK